MQKHQKHMELKSIDLFINLNGTQPEQNWFEALDSYVYDFSTIGNNKIFSCIDM